MKRLEKMATFLILMVTVLLIIASILIITIGPYYFTYKMSGFSITYLFCGLIYGIVILSFMPTFLSAGIGTIKEVYGLWRK